MPKRGREEVTGPGENEVDNENDTDLKEEEVGEINREDEDHDEEEDTDSDDDDDDDDTEFSDYEQTSQNFVAWLEEGATSLSVGEVHFTNVEHTGSMLASNTYCVVYELKLQPPPKTEMEEDDEEPPLTFRFPGGFPFRVLPAADCVGIPLDPVLPFVDEAAAKDDDDESEEEIICTEYSLDADIHQQFLQDVLSSISGNCSAKVPPQWKLPEPATDKAVIAGFNAWWNAGEAKTGWDISKIPKDDNTTETTLRSTDKSNKNILMDLYRDLCAFQPLTSEDDRDAIEERFEWRTCLCTYFAWAVPNEKAMEILRNLNQPILEIGAGTGYWAWLLSGNGDEGEGGVDIVAYDAIDSHDGHKHRFRHDMVRDGGVEQASSKEHAGRALMLCWPDIVGDSASDDADRGTFGYDTLKAYNQGDIVIYVGELGPSVVRASKGWGDPFPPGGSSASAAFQDELRARFELTQRVELPNWPPYNSHLTVWKRK
jgi:hypothetical protein